VCGAGMPQRHTARAFKGAGTVTRRATRCGPARVNYCPPLLPACRLSSAARLLSVICCPPVVCHLLPLLRMRFGTARRLSSAQPGHAAPPCAGSGPPGPAGAGLSGPAGVGEPQAATGGRRRLAIETSPRPSLSLSKAGCGARVCCRVRRHRERQHGMRVARCWGGGGGGLETRASRSGPTACAAWTAADAVDGESVDGDGGRRMCTRGRMCEAGHVMCKHKDSDATRQVKTLSAGTRAKCWPRATRRGRHESEVRPWYQHACAGAGAN
jgi:hypothetical protein